jgi:TPR repeat protein
MYEFGIGAACDKEKAFEIYEEAYALKFRDPRALYKLAVLKMLRSKN